MDIVMIAGLTNGRLIADYFMKSESDRLVKVYVLRDELGKNVSDFVSFDDIVPSDKLVKIDHVKNHEDEIAKINPDYIFVVGWSQLVSKKIIDSAQKGCIGFHPARLPKDRGRSVLAWQIAEGYERGCVSMFQIDEGIDSGKIIGQMDFEINYSDTVKDALERTYRCCLALTEKYFPLLKDGKIIPWEQNEADATYRRLRRYPDGIVDWRKPSRVIYNLIRAITYPYPLASARYKGKEIKIVKAFEVAGGDENEAFAPGTILRVDPNKGVLVKAKDNMVCLADICIDGEVIDMDHVEKYFKVGDCFSLPGDTILVIAVHPDDETLGMGGTICKHLANGDNVSWLIFTRTDVSLGYSQEQVDVSNSQKEAVARAYGFHNKYELGFLTTQLHAIDFNLIINKVSKIMHKVKPKIVYMINRTDVHTDHQIAARAVFSCTKSFRYPFIKKILMYECISETEMAPPLQENVFIPNCFSDISAYMEKKLAIMKIYQSELQTHPMPRSLENIKALALYRGAACGVDYAEAFMLVREML